MHHFSINLFMLSIPFSLFAESWWIFYLFGLPNLVPGYFILADKLEELSMNDLRVKLRRMHDRMDAVAKHVRRIMRQRADWEQAIVEVLPTLNDKTLRLVVYEVLRAEGYQLVRKPKDYRDHEETTILRKDGREIVLRLNPQAAGDADSTAMAGFVQTMCERHVDAGVTVAMGEVTDRAHVVADRNQIRVFDRQTLAKSLVANRRRIQRRQQERQWHQGGTVACEAMVIWN
ncbi:MAG: restriction endonuclease [Limisphaerales bacterium]